MNQLQLLAQEQYFDQEISGNEVPSGVNPDGLDNSAINARRNMQVATAMTKMDRASTSNIVGDTSRLGMLSNKDSDNYNVQVLPNFYNKMKDDVDQDEVESSGCDEDGDGGIAGLDQQLPPFRKPQVKKKYTNDLAGDDNDLNDRKSIQDEELKHMSQQEYDYLYQSLDSEQRAKQKVSQQQESKIVTYQENHRSNISQSQLLSNNGRRGKSAAQNVSFQTQQDSRALVEQIKNQSTNITIKMKKNQPFIRVGKLRRDESPSPKMIEQPKIQKTAAEQKAEFKQFMNELSVKNNNKKNKTPPADSNNIKFKNKVAGGEKDDIGNGLFSKDFSQLSLNQRQSKHNGQSKDSFQSSSHSNSRSKSSSSDSVSHSASNSNITVKSKNKQKGSSNNSVNRAQYKRRQSIFGKKLGSHANLGLQASQDFIIGTLRRSNSNRSSKKKQPELVLANSQNLIKVNLSKDDLPDEDSSSLESSHSLYGDSDLEQSSDDEEDVVEAFTNRWNNPDKLANSKTMRSGAFFNDFMALYSDSITEKKGKNTRVRCLIRQDKKWKLIWDIFLLFLLLIVCAVVPFRLAFSQTETLGYFLFYVITDSFFLIDIILTFFTSIRDKNQVYEITDKKLIAQSYIKGWFFIDVIAILPLDILFQSQQNENILARFTRIGKLYKLIRLIRLAKVLKLLQSRQKVVAQFNSKLSVSSGLERLVFFFIFLVFFFHISACMFVFLGKLDYDMNSWMWDPQYSNMDNYDLWILSFYFIVTTTSTVGYGDLSASTTMERMFTIVIMLAGVTSFTFISGALASILNSSDQSQADLHEKLLYLTKLRQQHNLSNQLLLDIQHSLQYDSAKQNVGLDQFILNLPIHLRLEVSEEIHKDSFIKFNLFRKVGNKNYLGWVSSKLKSQLFADSVYFYMRGDHIDNFYFCIKGVGAFVLSEQNNEMISIIDPELFNKTQKKSSKRLQKQLSVLQFFGAEDIIINAAAMLHDEYKKEGEFSFSSNGFKTRNSRYFSIQSIQESEMLMLSTEDMDNMKRDFPISTERFFKIQVQQTKNLLEDHLYALRNYKDKQYAIERFRRSPSKGQSKKQTDAKQVNHHMNQVIRLIKDQNTKGQEHHSSLEWTQNSNTESVKNADLDQSKQEQNNSGVVDVFPPSNHDVVKEQATISQSLIHKNANIFDEEIKVIGVLKQSKSFVGSKLSPDPATKTGIIMQSLPDQQLKQNAVESVHDDPNKYPSVVKKIVKIFTGVKQTKQRSKSQIKIQVGNNNESLGGVKGPIEGGLQMTRYPTKKSSGLQEQTPKSKEFERDNNNGNKNFVRSQTILKKRGSQTDLLQREAARAKQIQQRLNFKNYIMSSLQKKTKKIDKELSPFMPPQTNLAQTITSMALSTMPKIKSYQEPPTNFQQTQEETKLANTEKLLSFTLPPIFKQISSQLQPTTSLLLQDSPSESPAPPSASSSMGKIQLLRLGQNKQKSSGDVSKAAPSGDSIYDQKTIEQQLIYEKKLARDLMKSKPPGSSGLAYVLTEIRNAVNAGLIRGRKQPQAPQGQFAKLWVKDIKKKLSKQEKDRQLLRMIKTDRKGIVEKLMRESIIKNEENIQERMDKVFDKMADVQQSHLDSFINKVESDMQNVQNQLQNAKSQVCNIQEVLSKKKQRYPNDSFSNQFKSMQTNIQFR